MTRMPNTLATQIVIAAPSAEVWSVLTDFAAYPRWSPVIEQVRGRPESGARLTVRILGPTGRAVTARPTVVAYEYGLLRWDAVLLHPRILSGLHEFRLEAVDADTTVVHHRDTYSGLLARPLAPLLAANEPLMRRQNEALRDRVAEVAADRRG